MSRTPPLTVSEPPCPPRRDGLFRDGCSPPGNARVARLTTGVPIPVHVAIAFLLLAFATTACTGGRQNSLTVSVYQPLSGLHEPRVVDPGLRNFEGLRLTVHCVPGDYLTRGQNLQLCRRVGTLFENQGATVTTVDRQTVEPDPFADEPPQADPFTARGEADSGDAPPGSPEGDLILQIRSRRIAKNNRTLSFALSAATSFIILPYTDDHAFAQDITVRDADGFLLEQDTLRGRLIRRTGVFTWLGNWILDNVAREPEDRLTGDAAERDLSEDLYGTLTQIVYNARVRQRLQRERVR